jgi:hypothetical protein
MKTLILSLFAAAIVCAADAPKLTGEETERIRRIAAERALIEKVSLEPLQKEWTDTVSAACERVKVEPGSCEISGVNVQPTKDFPVGSIRKKAEVPAKPATK